MKEKKGSNNIPINELPYRACETTMRDIIDRAMDKDYIIRNEQKEVLTTDYLKEWDLHKY